ncbi:hypothetical protein ACQ4LE_004854 [Meloidogyne hapla]
MAEKLCRATRRAGKYWKFDFDFKKLAMTPEDKEKMDRIKIALKARFIEIVKKDGKEAGKRWCANQPGFLSWTGICDLGVDIYADTVAKGMEEIL